MDRARGARLPHRGGPSSCSPTAAEPDDLRIDELVGEVRADTPLATLERCVQLIPERFEYRAGRDLRRLDGRATCWRPGAGVCQDFAHLALVLLRRNGIAARYVSGYLFAPPNDQQDADSAEGRHARLAGGADPATAMTRCGSALDPTNRVLSGERHVKIGHGRRYRDIPPIKGVYRGSASAEFETSVRMHRTDSPARRASRG